MTARRTLSLAVAVAVAVVTTAALSGRGLRAQENGAAGSRTTVPPEDFGKWESFFQSTLSPDGAWLAVPINRVNDEDELRVRRVADPDSVIVVPYGSQAAFSGDGRWLAYSIGVSEDERERLQKQQKPVRNDLGLVDLRTGETVEEEDVSSFAFSGDGRWLAMRRFAPSGERQARGVDLVVRELATGIDVNFGNVSEFAWKDEGGLLAMLVDAEGMAGNGVRLWEPASGRLRTLTADRGRYSGLAWRDESADLAVFRSIEVEDAAAGDGTAAAGQPAEAWADTAQVVMAFIDVAEAGSTTALTLDPREVAAIPADHRVVPWQSLRWSRDGATLFLGIRERTPVDPCGGDAAAADPAGVGDEDDGDRDEREADRSRIDGSDDPPADTVDADACREDAEGLTVEIWHAGDVDIVPTQKVWAQRDRRENDLVAWHLAGGVVRLEDDVIDDVQIVDGATIAIGIDDTPWERERMFGPDYRDVYVIDLADGSRERALERVQHFYGASPEGRWLLFLEDDEYRTYDIDSRAVTCITCGSPTSFVDLENDHTVEQKPPFSIAGWLEDDEAVLIYDEHDVWRVTPDGSQIGPVTRGASRNVRHRRVQLDPDEVAIDPQSPQYYALFDDWRKAWGYGRAPDIGGDVEVLIFEEAVVTALQKADSAEVYQWRVHDFDDSPDVFVGGPDLDGRQVTRTNPFQDDYLWGRSELVTFRNEWGDTLQGALYYPAGWEEGRQYPMITYIYVTRSNAVRAYRVPSEKDYYNFQTWVQDGYFVFQPDIVYRDRNPGLSAVANIEPAVDAVIATGLVDPEGIGLIGHSWGGYQTTFFVTQSDQFAAAVAGAPLTNLFSMYLSVYWNSGGTVARMFEIDQGRMEVPFWEDEESYRANSPVFHIENMRTPLLMAQGTEDGAVDFNQGVEFYNAARRAGKDFVFLVYNDENHDFTREPNQRDYHRRINEWFGHYLKGEPAPPWMTEGVPYLEQPGGKRGR